MSKAKRLFVDGKYGQIHVRMSKPRIVTKRPLVCLHMFPQSGRNFTRFLEAASEERTVIAPDFPGYGESDSPPAPPQAADYAAAIWQAIDQLDLLSTYGCVDLFGIHAGSKLAVEVAFQRPAQINKIILCSCAILTSQEISELKNALVPAPLDDAGTRFQKFWELQTGNRGEKMSFDMMASGFAEMIRNPTGIHWGHWAVFDYNALLPERLHALPHSIALLNPGDDLYDKTPRSLSYLKRGVLIDRPKWNNGFLDSDASDLAVTVDEFLSREVGDSNYPASDLTSQHIAAE